MDSVYDEELARTAASAPALQRVVALTRWVGAGRKLTPTGRLTMADARHLGGLLGTGDEIDPVVGTRVFRTRSSADLPGLAVVVAWAKAVGLLRVSQGRLVPVKKNQRLLDQPEALWAAMHATFDRLGPALCPPGWFTSLLAEDFADGTAVLFAVIAEGGGADGRDELLDRVWAGLTARYSLHRASAEEMTLLRETTDFDVDRAVEELIALGAVVDDGGRLRLSRASEQARLARVGPVQPGDQVAQLDITLLDTDPPVWRRMLVPTTIPLDRLSDVIQAAMGWTGTHLHAFVHRSGRYGPPDPDFPVRDERRATLQDLAGDGFRYEYDFGDGWEHEIRLVGLVPAEPDGRYPACTDGARACPPEDCGGTPGYERLVALREWLGREFDPADFDVAAANRRILAA